MILEKVKTLCNSRGISINRLEQELGFSQGSIGKMGDSIPKADRLYKIASYFDVPMETFFGEDAVIEKIQSDIKDHIEENRTPYEAFGGDEYYEKHKSYDIFLKLQNDVPLMIMVERAENNPDYRERLMTIAKLLGETDD